MIHDVYSDTQTRPATRPARAMRQTGVLTAVCLYALNHHVERLAEEHALAQQIGRRLADLPAIAQVRRVETNMGIADLSPDAPKE